MKARDAITLVAWILIGALAADQKESGLLMLSGIFLGAYVGMLWERHFSKN